MGTYVAAATEKAVAVITMKTKRGLMMKRAGSTVMTRVLLVNWCANPPAPNGATLSLRINLCPS